MLILEDLKTDKAKLEKSIFGLVRKFEEKYGGDIVNKICLERYANNNSGYSNINDVKIEIIFR